VSSLAAGYCSGATGYYQPGNALARGISVLPFALLGCAVSVLAMNAAASHTLRPRRPDLVLVVLLFAAFVIGSEGRCANIEIPAGFVIALVAIWAVADVLGKVRGAALDRWSDGTHGSRNAPCAASAHAAAGVPWTRRGRAGASTQPTTTR
jgi:hypothetical protein